MAADRSFDEYHRIAEAALGRVTDQSLTHLIGGERVASVSGATFENSSPVDGGSLGTVASGGAADVGAAASAAPGGRPQRRAP